MLMPSKVDPAAQLHQGAQRDLHQREGKPHQGETLHVIHLLHTTCPSGEEAGGEGVVLQALRPQEPVHQARTQPVLLKLGFVGTLPSIFWSNVSLLKTHRSIKGCRRVQNQP